MKKKKKAYASPQTNEDNATKPMNKRAKNHIIKALTVANRREHFALHPQKAQSQRQNHHKAHMAVHPQYSHPQTTIQTHRRKMER